jgi:hypothetical protein
MAQGGDGIQAHGSACGNIAGDKDYASEQERNADKSSGIGGRDTEEQLRRKPHQQQGRSGANYQSDARHNRSIAQDKPQHIGTLRTKGHADSDLVRPQTRSIGDHAVNPDCRQN